MKNQFIMAPIKTGYTAGDGKVTEKHLSFYRKRSKFLGAVIPEPFYLDSRLRELPTQIGIDHGNKISGLKRLAEVIHNGGAKAIAHLNHPGRMANPKIPGNKFLSSTDRPCENGGETPKRMSREEISDSIKLFQEASTRAEQAGFDIIELQFGHGYLVAQFLSPRVNDRADSYGGSFKGRCKYGLELLRAVRSVTNLPVQIRISGDEMVDGGINLDQSKKFAKLLEENGAEAIHVSAGTVCETPPWYFQHMFVPKGETWKMAEKIKNEVSIPIVAVGKVNKPEDIQMINENNMAGYIAVGRALLADPDFIGKYLGRTDGRIRPCLECSDGCLGGVKSGSGLGCLMNPELGTQNRIVPTNDQKRVAVVGGGLAGMSAAVAARKRGHEVTLFEKDKLGGVFNLAFLPPGKQSLQRAVEYFSSEIEDWGVQTVYQEAFCEDLADFDVVVLATGAKPFVPPIDGLKEFHWAEILKKDNLPEAQRIMVIGGGLVGVEVTKSLASNGNDVVVVEMLPELAGNMIALERAQLLASLRGMNNVQIYTDTSITRIDGGNAYGESNGEEIRWKDIDRYVVVTGMKSYTPIEEDDLNLPVYVVGDADEPAKAKDAIKSGYEVGSTI